MKGFTIYSLFKHAELGSLLESYCQRIGKLSSSNHDLDSLFSLLFEVSILFTEEKACYKTMGTVINRQNEIERNIAEMEKGIQETAPCINKLRKIFKGLQNTLYNERKPKMYINSEMFYKQQIEQLDKKEKELDDALQRLDKYAQEIGVDDLSFKRNNKIQDRIWYNHYKKQLEEEQFMAQRQSDAQSNLKKKIEESFSILTCDVNPINVEKERLEKLFHIFKRSMVGVVLFLLVWEVVCVWVWIADDWPHSLIEYMPFYLPIPLCVGLFWVAIFQMNRAQRQLLFLTNQFHHDHYIESLLLVINNISFNALDGAEKIRTIVEKMIEGYIHFGNNVVEKHINEEIEKDKINLLSLFHLMEKAKGLFAVSK